MLAQLKEFEYYYILVIVIMRGPLVRMFDGFYHAGELSNWMALSPWPLVLWRHSLVALHFL